MAQVTRRGFWTMLLALGVTFSVAATCAGLCSNGTVYLKKGGAPYFVAGKMDKAGAAYGMYNNTLMQTGWGILEVRAGYGAPLSNNQIMFAAGYLEGVFTAKQMKQHLDNLKSFVTSQGSKILDKLRQYFKEQDEWMRNMISKHGKTDPLWRHTSYILSQFDGLVAGYAAVMGQNISDAAFVAQILNGVGDIIDLRHALDPATMPDFTKLTKPQMMQYLHRNGHCSALVKVLGAYEDIFMSHSSWFVYAATMRIYKHYDFNVNDPFTGSKQISFSSYPGFLESLDDFYLLSSQMVMLQTTNNVFNQSLYKHVVPQSLLSWQRVRVANMMARSGKQWADVVAQYNSGTYNNQYMIVDLKRVELGKTLLDGALWVVEQIPTLVAASDQTAILRTGYWPSYNVPFHESVYNLSGYPAMVAKLGVDMSYQLAPRAKIFRRDQAKVLNMTTMQAIMRYNDYKHDRYSEGNPCNTICCRGDLGAGGSPDGCYDTKVADYKMALKRQAWIINGPTLGNKLNPFSWTGPFAKYSHEGLPAEYKFGWVWTEPIL